MNFTDLFIRRPVLATVISLMILALGLRSIFLLPIRQYPFTQNAVVNVNTTYTGADPALIAGFITTPLENAIAQASGINYMTSSSTQGMSSISVNLLLNYDPLKAVSDVMTKVNGVLNQLPKQSQLPMVGVTVGETIASMYLGFYSKELKINQITDYLTRIVQPKLQAINGVQKAQILGSQLFALRAWLDPIKLAGFGLTPADVSNALSQNDYISAAGRTDGQMFVQNLIVGTNLTNVEEFENLVLKTNNGAIVRLKDVAKVELGAQNYDVAVSFDGKGAVYIGITVAPAANLLSVISEIREIFPSIHAQLPKGLEGQIVYDASKYVDSSIEEVVKSLVEAIVIVSLVIFLFLGELRSVMIPVIAIPLSLIGTFFIMLLLGYSINLLSLLALVLAIGLVVDDAIIVVENVQRHMEEGKTAREAAILGARELSNPIIAITVVLIAVYAPIGFMGGLTGALFTEFAFTLAGAVTVSAIIALSLSPVMSAKFLKISKNNSHRFLHFINRQFERLQHTYEYYLRHSLQYLSVTIVFAIIILLSNYVLFISANAELAPQEDQGILISLVTAPANASLAQTQLYSNSIFRIFHSYKETDHIFQIDGSDGLNSSIIGMVLKPWDERRLTTNDLQGEIQQKINQIAGAKSAVFQPPSLPGGGGGMPVQFVVTTTNDFDRLHEVVQNILEKANGTGKFMFIDPDLKIDQFQTTVKINRDKAALLGINMQEVGDVLASALSGGYINYFDYAGRAYQVIPQMDRAYRINASQLLNYYISTGNGTQIPLSTIGTLAHEVVPQSLNHFQQLNSATISAVPMPGVTLGEALGTFQQIAQDVLPEGYGIDYAGQSRQYIQEGSALLLTFFFALIIIYLSLAALFESFRDPFIVLISVPMSICGAMIFISLGLGGASLNIYSEVGLVTLIGLISKHGILIVQFANDLQLEGKAKYDALVMAAGIRLRPILMTTAAMVLGVFPLIFAQGAGAESRFNIGLVIATGISIGTLFTLFVVPAMYMLLADDLHEGRVVSEEFSS